jgi:hypothetical protein
MTLKCTFGFTSTITCLVFAITCASAPSIAVAGKGGGGGKGGGNAGSGDGGEETPVYTAAGDLISNPIDSTNLNFDEIIFRPDAGFTFNLSGFPVSDPNNGGACLPFSAAQTGTLVLAPADSASSWTAELRFGFQGQLSDGGNSVQHFLVMHGHMSGAWMPTGTTTLELYEWSIAAENKKSQRSDCEGSGNLTAPVIIGVGPASP